MFHHHPDESLSNSEEDRLHRSFGSNIANDQWSHYSESRDAKGKRYAYAGVRSYDVFGKTFYAVVFSDVSLDYQAVYTDSADEALAEYTAVVLGLADGEFIFDRSDVSDDLLFAAKQGRLPQDDITPYAIILD